MGQVDGRIDAQHLLDELRCLGRGVAELDGLVHQRGQRIPDRGSRRRRDHHGVDDNLGRGLSHVHRRAHHSLGSPLGIGVVRRHLDHQAGSVVGQREGVARNPGIRPAIAIG